MKVALVYDRVNKWGGAERVLLALHKIFPQAKLFTSVYEKRKAPWAKVFEVKTSFLQGLPLTTTHHEYLAAAMPLAFESFDFKEFDLVISVTSEAAKGIITGPKTKHVCICLTPTRYLWSGYDEYFSDPALKFVSKPIIAYLRKWDKVAASRPNQFIAISKEVQKRIKKYYNRESTVIYPPFFMDQRNLITNSPKGEYFLVVSRLSRFTKYKRVDLAVRACSNLNLPLVVIGEGNAQSLKSIAGPTIKFTGRVTDDQLANYYQNCRAVIFPSFEDFGLVPVEAQSFGKPVIAYGKGGALETVIKGKTGIFFYDQTVKSLTSALKKFNDNDYNIQECVKNSQRFSFAQFEKSLNSVLKI